MQVLQISTEVLTVCSTSHYGVVSSNLTNVLCLSTVSLYALSAAPVHWIHEVNWFWCWRWKTKKQNNANLMACTTTCMHTNTPTLYKNFCFLTFKSPESRRYVNMSFHQPSVLLPSCRMTNPANLMARIILTLLRADRSSDPSYSKTSLETLAVLHRRFQHVSLYWHRGGGTRRWRRRRRGVTRQHWSDWFLAS